MKLINHTLLILSVILFTTVGLWAILFNSQLLKQVIENTSHELQTPMAICINKLELLAEDEVLSR